MTERGRYEVRSDEAIIDHFSQVAYTVHPLNSRAWDGIYIVGKTAIGHTTVRTLDMNSDDQLSLRAS
jgi:hypothetical protein